MRLLCAQVLVVGLLLALAGPARAGGAFTYPPVTTEACGDFDVSTDAMVAPETAFINAESPEVCAKLCKSAAKLCVVYVKDVSSCRRRVYSNRRTFGKANCESEHDDPAIVKQCKKNVDEEFGVNLGFHDTEHDSQLDSCGAWATTCRAACHL